MHSSDHNSYCILYELSLIFKFFPDYRISIYNKSMRLFPQYIVSQTGHK